MNTKTPSSVDTGIGKVNHRGHAGRVSKPLVDRRSDVDTEICNNATNHGSVKGISRHVDDCRVLLALHSPIGQLHPDNNNNNNSSISNHGGTTDAKYRDDKVVTILQNILRNLEQEIRADRNQIKESRKAEREQRRLKRLQRATTMATGQDRSSVPSPPVSSGEPTQSAVNRKRRMRKLRGQDRLSVESMLGNRHVTGNGSSREVTSRSGTSCSDTPRSTTSTSDTPPSDTTWSDTPLYDTPNITPRNITPRVISPRIVSPRIISPRNSTPRIPENTPSIDFKFRSETKSNDALVTRSLDLKCGAGNHGRTTKLELLPDYKKRPVAVAFRRRTRVPLTAGGRVQTDRPVSAGTSGYSSTAGRTTDESSDSESADERERRLNVNEQHVQRQLNKYFLLIPRGSNMALKMDEARIPDQEMITQNSQPIPHNVSMSDLVLPDHVGWLTDQSEHTKVWGVVVDMMFCVFENEDSHKPLDVILLPGCNIRPLVYKTAINGLNGRRHSKTITGVAKFQIVIDNLSKRRKHLFSFDTQHDLDTWYSVLKKASNLDPDSTNDVASGDKVGEQSNGNVEPSSCDDGVDKKGYMPSNDTLNRVQKLSKSSRDSAREKVTSKPFEDSDESPNTSLNAAEKPSPRAHGVMRTDSKSVQDFRKLLRRDGDTDSASKQLPVKAQHFAPTPSMENKNPQGKKLRSFGSFESLLKFKKKRKKKDILGETISNDETGSITSNSSSIDLSRSVDFSASKSQLKKSKTKQLSRSLDLGTSKHGLSTSLVRRASDIKDRVFPRRPSKRSTKLGDLQDVSIHGYLHHKHHLKWQKLWCVVCRGCFYGFKSQSPDDCAQLAVVLSNCAVVYVAEREKRAKRLYVFKLSQENVKSVYLCAREHEELQEWLQVLQFESNNVQCDLNELLGKYNNMSDTDASTSTTSPRSSRSQVKESRSRSKKSKRAPARPRHSSCPPPETRDQPKPERGGESSTDDCWTSGSSQTEESAMFGSADDLPRHDRSVTHVWQNERGYLFNVIRAKMTAYRRRQEGGNIYNTDLPGPGNEGLLLLNDQPKKGSREVRRSRSFSAHSRIMDDSPTKPTASVPTSQSPTNMRRRHKPLVVKRVPAVQLEPVTMAGYMERKNFSGQWNKYWYILHEGTLFCYLTSDDNVTVDVLHINGYEVTEMVDKFRGKRFVIQLSHEKFTSLYLSLEAREEMSVWHEHLTTARQRPCSSVREEDDDKGACSSCESNRADEMGDKRKLVKQKLLDEMLRQKHELERKQAERHKKQRGKDPNTNSNDFTADEQRTSDVTRLRQRRMSTQLKLDAIEKQMLPKTNNQKRGLFGFGKQKKVDENKNVFFQDQLKELCGKLTKIDSALIQVRQDAPLDVYDVNQNRKQSSTVSDQDITVFVNGQHDQDNGSAKTGTGLKASVQNWTKKTFKASTKRKSLSVMRVPENGSVPNLSKQNGDVRHHSYDNDNDANMEEYMSSDNSVTDLTRPTADLKLDIDTAPTSPTSTIGSYGSGSPTSSRSYARSNSVTSNTFSMPSPRREIKASVLAEIDAFEELTRQVLGARSKEMPAV